jgi:hypothetical protein
MILGLGEIFKIWVLMVQETGPFDFAISILEFLASLIVNPQFAQRYFLRARWRGTHYI